jgi:signal peptidase II
MLYLLLVGLIAVDQLSKDFVLKNYNHLVVSNGGVAFSLLSNHTPVITILVFIVIVALFIVIFKVVSTLWKIGLIVLLAGASSNELDRLFRHGNGIFSGKVIDFINYNNFFTGNIADVFVVVSCLFLLILLLKNISPFRKK